MLPPAARAAAESLAVYAPAVGIDAETRQRLEMLRRAAEARRVARRHPIDWGRGTACLAPAAGHATQNPGAGLPSRTANTMSLSPPELTALSDLLDQALDLAPDAREAWMDRLGPTVGHLRPTLRQMLAEHAAQSTASGFLAHGPHLPGESTAQPGDLIGLYRLLREIGRGGMATVWLAERIDGVVKRQVAMKMLLVGLGGPSHAERFERERDVLAMLDHPRIARLIDAGVAASGRPFIAMEHVVGRPITEACDLRRMPTEARLRLFMQVLAAVAHAHKHLVVHRDIKPSNVFVDEEGRVKLLDFGIAKLLDTPAGATAASELTRDGGCLMTPRYAAPEQLARGPISTATDVYALGALLHELLVGAPPHAGRQGSVAEAIDAALHSEPKPPSRAPLAPGVLASRGLVQPAALRSLLSGDLDTIVLKALRKAPAERYSSVERFADDLQRFLDHRPIAAKPPGWAHRLGLFVRRHRPVALASAIGVVAAIALAGVAGQQHGFGIDQQARAEAVRDFMVDMVESAEADESRPTAEVTGQQMVEGGLRRAHERFAGQPLLLGDVLGSLGRMLQRFGDDAQAARAFMEADRLLSAYAPAADPARNKVRVSMASLALGANDLTRARSLAIEAQQACRGANPECAKARAYAGNILAELDQRSGHAAEAIAHMHQSVADTSLGFGSHHPETAIAWHYLAVYARNAGELREADAAIRQALTMAAKMVLPKADRTAMSRTQAMLELDLGRFQSARDLLQALIAQSSREDERALQWRLLSSAEHALGHGDAAMTAADQALALADPASADPEVWFARQAHARAACLLGQCEAALAEMHDVLRGLAVAGFAPTSAQVLRAQRFVAETLAESGDAAAAQQAIDAVIAKLGQQGSRASIELGLSLALRARLRGEAGEAAEATVLRQRAQALLLAQLPADHPLLRFDVPFQWVQRSGD